MNATNPGSAITPGGTTGPVAARQKPGPRAERRFTGIAAAPGVAIGPIFRATEPEIPITQAKIAAGEVAAEGARLDTAIAQSR